MANNYEQFSEIIECKTALQREDLLARLRGTDNSEYVCDAEPQGDLSVWLHADEWADMEELANVLQSHLRKFDIDGNIIISVAYSCDKPRVAEFGGFAWGITKDKIECLDARHAMKCLLERK